MAGMAVPGISLLEKKNNKKVLNADDPMVYFGEKQR
jgi:hypothetical protein